MATISTTLTLVDRITGPMDRIRRKFETFTEAMNGVEEKVNGFDPAAFEKKWTKVGNTLTEIGNKLTSAFSLPASILGVKMYDAATDYESALAGVQKTTNATGTELEALNQRLLEISENMPIQGGYVKAAATMQLGAQMGIHEQQELENFTRTYEALVKSTDIAGESGALDLAKFMNLTEGGVKNVDRVAGVIVDLGNNSATTENAILSMGTRMAGTGDLAGFTSAEILAMATTFSSLGIEAEAGGSAASKAMKKMQGAAETGFTYYNDLLNRSYSMVNDGSYAFGSIHELQMWLDGLQSSDISSIASGLNLTVEQFESTMDAVQNLEWFAEISGKTAQQFVNDWANNPAQNMIDFFNGLFNLDASGAESTLAVLERMGLTEIRLSNLLAATAGNPDMLNRAVQMAYAAYAAPIDTNALWTEYDIFANTQASRDQMLKNKATNTMANLGGNVVEAAQPMLDYINNMLDTFNAMEEVDQDKIVKLMGAFIFTPLAVKAAGEMATAISKIGTAVSWINANGGIPGVLGKAVGFASKGWGFFAGTVAFAAAIDAIPTKLETLQAESQSIKLSFDQDSVDAALAQIAEVQAAVDLLSGGETTQQMKDFSAAVAAGFGTESMYNSALAYESAAANDAINRVYAQYGQQLSQKQIEISRAATAEQQQALLDEYYAMEAEMYSIVNGMRSDYTGVLSNLFTGMLGQYSPEALQTAMSALENYNLVDAIYQVQSFDESLYATEEAAVAAWDALNRTMYSMAFDVGYNGFANGATLDEWMHTWVTGGRVDFLSEYILGQATSALVDAQRYLEGNPYISTLLQSMLQSGAVMENIDFVNAGGALEGIVKLLDFKAAYDYNDVIDFGENLVLGAATGVSDNAYLMEKPAYDIRDSFIESIQTAFIMHSPSRLMAMYGVYLPAGMAEGVRMGETILTAAVDAVGGAAAQQAALILNMQTGYMVGAQYANGIAIGIRVRIPAIRSAAMAAANAADIAVRTALDIHSPSRVAMESGAYFGEGLAEGILSRERAVERAAGSLAGAAYRELNNAVWDEIALFSGLENEQLVSGDDLHISDGDIKRMRQLAEREVVNHFAAAQLHIDFTANNNINSEMDIDGVVGRLEEILTERMEMAAEGVYS